MPSAVGTTDLRRLVLVAIVAIAGCGAPAGGSGPPASPKVSCLGVPAARCDEAVASVARSLPNSTPVSIDVSCVSGTCTLEAGSMDTLVTLADGSHLRGSTLSWNDGAGGRAAVTVPPVPPIQGPALPVTPQCVGVPMGQCQSLAQSSVASDAGRVIVQIVVQCSDSMCTDTKGEGSTVITYADGTTETTSWGYVGAG